jgi:hypothetical protein
MSQGRELHLPVTKERLLFLELSPVNGETMHSSLNPHRFTHQPPTFPITSPPSTGSGPSFDRSVGPPQTCKRISSHLRVLTFIRFIPLASEFSIGAILHRKSDAKNEETKDIRADEL